MYSLATFPDIKGKALTGRGMHLPADFAANRNLVILAFLQWQQTQVDQWIDWAVDSELVPPALPGTAPGDKPWTGSRVERAVYEIPVLARRWSLGQALIDGGMAASIRNPIILARTITLYTDVSAMCAAVGVESTENVSALVVEPGGSILARVTGPCEKEFQRPIKAALTAAL